MTDQTPAYLLITTDQSVNPINTPFPSIESALHDAEKSVPLLSEQLRARFNAEGRLRMVFFCLTVTSRSGHVIQQQMHSIVPVGKTAFYAFSALTEGEWETLTMHLDPDTWETLILHPPVQPARDLNSR